MKRILVIDVEANGLHGEELAVAAAVVGENGTALTRAFSGPCLESYFRGRVGQIPKKVDPWVRENVLPQIAGLPKYRDARALREAFWAWFQVQKKTGAIVAVDCGYPVETGFLSRCQRDSLKEREMAGPYPLHEVGTILLMAGLDPDINREDYVKKVLRADGWLPMLLTESRQHNPLRDCVMSALCALKAMGEVRDVPDCSTPGCSGPGPIFTAYNRANSCPVCGKGGGGG